MTSDERTVRALFAALDAGDAPSALELFTEDVRFQFGNADPTAGHDGFAASAAGMLTAVARMSHDLTTVWSIRAPEPAVICEMSVAYERHDGARVTLPCINVFRLRDGRIADYRVYMDINPVFSTTGPDPEGSA